MKRQTVHVYTAQIQKGEFDMTLFFRAIVAFSLVFASAHSTVAQQMDSIFDNAEHLTEFLDEQTFKRDFATLIATLGGRDEYTTEELTSINNQFRAIYTSDFDTRASVKSRELASGFKEEIIAYWYGLNYLWIYLMTHEVDGKTVVISFYINSNRQAIFEKF